MQAFGTPPPLDAKLACLDRDHEEKISHWVSQPQVREGSLTMPLPISHRVAEEAPRRLDLGPATVRSTRPAGFALTETAEVVARNFVAIRLPSVLDVTMLHGAINHLLSFYPREGDDPCLQRHPPRLMHSNAFLPAH